MKMSKEKIIFNNKNSDNSNNINNTNTTKPFYFIRYKRSENFSENIKSTLCIFLLSLPFIGILIFSFVLLYMPFFIKIIFIILVISQYFFEGRIEFFYNFIKYLKVQNYFKSFTIICEDEISKNNTMLPFSPHGIIANTISSAVCSGWVSLDNFKILATRLVIYIPLSGFFARLLGIQGVNSKNFIRNLEKNKNIIFIPGGYECATFTNDEYDQIFIKERKGFIKYALMYGYKVHPCYNFGENKLYYMIKNYYLRKFGLFLNKFKIPGVFFYGKYLIFPRTDVDLCCVIGKVIQFPKIENPTKKEIEEYHNLYISKLKELYDKYKNIYGGSENLLIN
jgi:hypothetical protein